MSEVEILRRAAALMRERATEAGRGLERWRLVEGGFDTGLRVEAEEDWTVVGAEYYDVGSRSDVTHIASWDPAVAHSVALWLEREASEANWDPYEVSDEALAVARAYLREDDDA